VRIDTIGHPPSDPTVQFAVTQEELLRQVRVPKRCITRCLF